MTVPASTWRDVLIIRHGATALNSNDHTVDRIRGWTDWPLSEQGIVEAKKLTAMIASNPPNILLTSDLLRAQQTGRIIAAGLGISFSSRGRDFRPWNVGHFAGKKASEVIPVLAQYASGMSYQIVADGESFDDFRARFFSGLLKAFKRHYGLVGIVTHHRCERLIKAWAKAGYPENGDVDLDEFTKKGEPTGHCEIIKIPVDRLELWREWFKLQYAFGDGREEMWQRPVDFEMFTR